MCNAKYHPDYCRCGFGGEGHLGSATLGFGSSFQHYLVLKEKRQFTYSDPISYLIPNAKCPECWHPVFFLKLNNGGRVFFDEIGPPWPKHPCTNQQTRKTNDYDLLISNIIVEQKKYDDLKKKFYWKIVTIKRIARTERILLGIADNENIIPQNLWINYDSEIANLFSKKDVIIYAKKEENLLSLFWHDLETETSGENKSTIINLI
jgi:hypothetical protein